jgi:ketosteroid isomerase-like protein
LEPLSLQTIEEHVRHHWKAFENKDTDYLAEAYSQASLIFTTSSKRVELGRLVIMHRQREYLSPQTKLRIDVRDIYAHLVGDRTALAAYILEFHAHGLPHRSVPSEPTDEHHSSARITQVFERAENGRLLIIHEHISVAQN